MNDWKNKTILIAEDDSINFKLMDLMLRKTGVNIIWAKNGKEALEFANSMNLDAILLDVQMPIMDGTEAASKIREFDKNVPIVILSAYSASELESSYILRTETNDILSKPVKADKLYGTIDKYLSGKN